MIPTTYLLTVERGKSSDKDDFSTQADKARKNGWPVLMLEADHNPQWSTPLQLVLMFQKIKGD